MKHVIDVKQENNVFNMEETFVLLLLMKSTRPITLSNENWKQFLMFRTYNDCIIILFQHLSRVFLDKYLAMVLTPKSH